MRFSKVFWTILLCVYISAVSPACADSRTAGTGPGEAQATKKKSYYNTDSDAERPAVLPANFRRLESLGPLTPQTKGGLGVDLWEGLKRTDIYWLIENAPAASRYKSLNRLTRRILLTQADAGLMEDYSEPEPGADLYTVRLHKLLEIGAFNEAADLYGMNPDEPYQEALARGGILALFYSGNDSLACLEVKALYDRFMGVSFWQDARATCDYLLTRNSDEKPEADDTIQSKLIKKAIEKEKFRLKVKSPDDIESLSAMEKAFFLNDGRFDYSGLKSFDPAEISPQTAALMRQDSNLPADERFVLIVFAVDRGLADVNALEAFYKEASLGSLAKNADDAGKHKEHSGWKKLAFLYQSALPANRPLLESLVTVALTVDEPDASLAPFASYIAKTDPAALTGESVRKGLRVMLETGTEVPDKWIERWQAIENNDFKDIFLQTALAIQAGFSSGLTSDLLKTAIEKSEKNPAKALLVQMVSEKLDKNNRMAEYTAESFYEKQIDLTFGVDYVMPSISLMESLDRAYYKKRLGEVVLLGSIALSGIPPEYIYPGFLQEIVNGFWTVGLTNEAWEITKEIILALSR